MPIKPAAALCALFVVPACAALAACPGEERIDVIVRARRKAEPVRGLPADLAMEDAICIRDGMVARLGVVGKGIPVEATEKFAATLAAMRVVVTDQDGAEIASGLGTTIKVRYFGLPGDPDVSVIFK